MSTLYEKSMAIKDEKDLKIVPENIKKGITMFGINGSFKGDCKIYKTMTAMKMDANAEIDDYAVVYDNSMSDWEEDTLSYVIAFPKIISLETPLEQAIYPTFEAIKKDGEYDYDNRINFYIGTGEMSFSTENWESYGDQTYLRWTGDGAGTYTLNTRETAHIIKETDEYIYLDLGFGLKCYVQEGQEYDERIGIFIKAMTYDYSGFYQYGTIEHNRAHQAYNVTTKEFTNSYFKVPEEFIGKDYGGHPTYIVVKTYHYDALEKWNVIDTCDVIFGEATKQNEQQDYHSYQPTIVYINSSSKIMLGMNYSSGGGELDVGKYIYHYDFTDGVHYTYEYIRNLEAPALVPVIYVHMRGMYEFAPNSLVLSDNYHGSSLAFETIAEPGGEIISQRAEQNVDNYLREEWSAAKSQLTANEEDVYGTNFIGEKGIGTGTLSQVVNITTEQVRKRAKVWSHFGHNIVMPEDSSEAFSSRYYSLSEIPNINTSLVTNMSSMFSGAKINQSLSFDTSNVTNMSGMFSSSNINGSVNFDTSNVTNMSEMFSWAYRLPSGYENFNTTNVTNMYNIFARTSALTNVPNWNYSNVKNIRSGFVNANLTEVTNLSLPNTSIDELFANCINLRSCSFSALKENYSAYALFYNCPNLNYVHFPSNVSTITGSNMFTNATNITINVIENSGLNTDYMKNGYGMFAGMGTVTSIPNLNFTACQNTISMFSRCRNLTSINLLKFPNMTDAEYMFANCNKLSTINGDIPASLYNASFYFSYCSNITSVNLSGMTGVNDIGYMFYNCINLRTITEFASPNLTGAREIIGKCNNLSNASILNLVNSLLNCPNVSSSYKNLSTANWLSPFYNTKFTSAYYSSKLSELTAAGWTY